MPLTNSITYCPPRGSNNSENCTMKILNLLLDFQIKRLELKLFMANSLLLNNKITEQYLKNKYVEPHTLLCD